MSDKWVHPVNVRYVQLRLPYTYRKVVPTVVGYPVALTVRYPTILSVAVKDLKLRVREHAAAVSLVPDLNEMLLYARQKSES